VVHEIRFSQYGNATTDSEQPADIEVLSSLWFDRFIRGDHQQNQIDPPYASQHVANETLVPGNVHETKTQMLSPRQINVQVREPNINGDTAALLFLKAVRVNPCESPN
jgi:hypothetical protein